MTDKNFWHIKQGSFENWNETMRGWTVHLSGAASIACDTLKEAKSLAIAHGASGKWERSTVVDGRKNKTVYHDAEGGQRQ